MFDDPKIGCCGAAAGWPKAGDGELKIGLLAGLSLHSKAAEGLFSALPNIELFSTAPNADAGFFASGMPKNPELLLVAPKAGQAVDFGSIVESLSAGDGEGDELGGAPPNGVAIEPTLPAPKLLIVDCLFSEFRLAELVFCPPIENVEDAAAG